MGNQHSSETFTTTGNNEHEFTKVSPDDELVSTTFKIVEAKDLALGGREGSKHELVLAKGDDQRTYSFFAKEYPSPARSPYPKEYVIQQDLRAYKDLMKLGYPVPPTVRKFDSGDKDYLLMTDLTQNGRYALFGISNNMSQEQLDVLYEMNLSAQNIKNIMSLIDALNERALSDGVSFRFWNYHIRKDSVTGDIDLCLLDIDNSSTRYLGEMSDVVSNYRVEVDNKEAKATFIGMLREHLDPQKSQ